MGEAFLNVFFAGSFLALSVSCIFTEREGSISRYHCLISTDGSVFFSSFFLRKNPKDTDGIFQCKVRSNESLDYEHWFEPRF